MYYVILGLLPHGQLDPPLWSQRGIGRIFPWPPKSRRRPLPSVLETSDEMPIDYVFRVVNKSNAEEFRKFNLFACITIIFIKPTIKYSSCYTSVVGGWTNKS